VIAVTAANFVDWRLAARTLLNYDVGPDEVTWPTEKMLFTGALPSANQLGFVKVLESFLRLAETVAMHSDADRWACLYRVLYRTTHGERDLLHIGVDDDVRRLHLMAKAVVRDMHKMKAFVRFRLVSEHPLESAKSGICARRTAS
jgi:uracil-DNA glycosylase